LKFGSVAEKYKPRDSRILMKKKKNIKKIILVASR
jgi:hypothetical protein